MSNVFGNNLKLMLFGESHGDYIGATLDGITPGIKIDFDFIDDCLSKRRPKEYETNRVEKDEYEFISGLFNGYTTGEPLTVLIRNENISSKDYSSLKDIPRPSHTDYVKNVWSDGYFDYRGGGHSSARLTAPLVILGSILLKALEEKNIYISSHIKSIGSLEDESFSILPSKEELIKLNNMDFPLLSNKKKEMVNLIEKVKEEGDSIGGSIETIIIGLKAGLGSPYFNSAESEISSLMFSIPGVKAISFGLGQGFETSKGSLANDAFYLKDSKVLTKTNNNGGINGGLTNSMPLLFRLSFRPTASIYIPQETINLKENKNEILELKGRHDPCIVRRASIIVRCLTAIAVSDMLLSEDGRKALK